MMLKAAAELDEHLPLAVARWSWLLVVRYALYILVLAAIYWGAAVVGHLLTSSTTQVTAIWPPTGVALTALLLFGRRVWPGVFLGALLVHISVPDSWEVSLCIASSDTLWALAGLWVLRTARFDGALERTRDVLALIAIAIVSPLVSASLGTVALVLGRVPLDRGYLGVWYLSWVGGTLGILMLTPLLLTWFYHPRIVWRERMGLEFAAYLLLLLLAGVVAFALPRTPYAQSYVAFPLLIWAGLRMGPRETALGACLLSLFSYWGAINGWGPFGGGPLDERLLALDVFIGVISCTVLLVSAVTAERRNAQLRARNSQDMVSAVFEHSPAVIYVKDKSGRFLMVNQRFAQLFHVEAHSVIGKSNHEVFPKETADRFHAIDMRVIEAREALTVPEEIQQDDGLHTYISVKCPLWDGKSEPAAVMGISTDITELHQAQEQLHRAHHDLENRVSERTTELAGAVARLRDANAELERRHQEKETLIKEIHHRVKNNMQVISSLLNLQAQDRNEPGVRAFVEDSQSRVRSMALVHEHLYRSDDLQSVPMSAYLRAVVDGIKQAQDLGRKVLCEVSENDIVLPIDLAIPCGLIVNEIVTNALKHAFPDDRAGRVQVSMWQTSQRALKLEIKDDGIGIPLPLDQRQQNFGLRLVGMLASQLHGKIETEQSAGLVFRLEFQRGA
jgi:PAS domain S-box-containing protein